MTLFIYLSIFLLKMRHNAYLLIFDAFFMTYSSFQHLSEVEEYFKERILQTQATAIIGGHFALEPEYKKEGLEVKAGIEEDDTFGAFPLATWDYACKLVSFAKEHGKQSKLVLMIDDHSLMNPRNWYAQTETDENSQQIQGAVHKYFKTFDLPASYQEIMFKNSVGKSDLLSSKHGLSFFQESKYRLDYLKKHGVDRTCAGEFELILEDITQAGFDNVLGYIPLRCREPTCGALVSSSIEGKRKSRPLQGDLVYLITHSKYCSREDFEAVHNEDHHGILFFHCEK